MTCYEIQKYGGPDGLKLVERTQPEPGDHDVVVRFKAASLNYRDLVVLRANDRESDPASFHGSLFCGFRI
jgi:NADPH:quinone reductase-like Zn-dependent oxidoreductase